MSSESKFLDMLRDFGNEIPRFSTDFITPDGIDWNKLKNTVRTASFKSIMPACTMATDLAVKLLENSNNRGMKDFVSFARNSIALYSILDNIYTNVMPSNAMENRTDIQYWKNIAAKFNVDIPVCDNYSSACAGSLPINEILMYLVYKLRLKQDYNFSLQGKHYSFRIEGSEGDAPTITSNGNIMVSGPICVLFRCKQLAEPGGEVLSESMYVLMMDRFKTDSPDSYAAMTSKTGDGGPQYIGGQILTERAAFIKESSRVNSMDAIQSMIAYVYRELDSSKYHYHVDGTKLYVRPNNRGEDDNFWVDSNTMKDVSLWCDRAAEKNITMSYALVGPPGTGKTTSCEHIMWGLAEKGYMVITCSLSDRMLDEILARIILCTNMSQKAVVLLDDLDSLDIRRKSSEVSTLIEFFAKVHESLSPVIVLSTINNPLGINETIMERPGRIDETIIVDFPEAELVEKLLRNYTEAHGYSLSDEVYAETARILADKHSFSAADIKYLTTMVFIKHGIKESYTQEEMNATIENMLSSKTASRKNYCTRDALTSDDD